ncbi:hypothetical protein L8Q43_22460, partial [Enterobacter roggenkampii]|nr:hypothetical protein [Enterobacter roggenkampii]
MSTITKEWLQKAISQHENMRDEIPFGLDEDDSNTLAAMKLALASLEAEAVAFRSKLQPPTAIGSERWDYTDHRQPDAFELENCFIERLFTAPPAPANAEPVAWLWSHRKHPIEVTLVRPEDDERAEGAHWSGWSCQALYAAPPAPVSVPYELTREEYKRRFMEEDNFNDTFRGGWNACRATMLQGAEPVTTACKLSPHVYRELVNSLRDTAVKYQGCQQLREQISKTLSQVITHTPHCSNSPVIPDDVRRMDWLVSKTVDVREPMVYGSHSLFWSQTITDEEDDYHATKLREQIDAAMEAEQAAAPQQE